MKIVIFGPEHRLGALAGDCVIDLSRGFPRYSRQHYRSTSQFVKLLRQDADESS